MPLSKAEAFRASDTAPPVKPEASPPIRQVNPSGEARVKTKARESGLRARSRPPRPSESVPFENNWGGRCVLWAAGKDPQGPLSGFCGNCRLGPGKRSPRHIGTPRQNLGNPCHVPRRFPKSQGSDVFHWAKDCHDKE